MNTPILFTAARISVILLAAECGLRADTPGGAAKASENAPPAGSPSVETPALSDSPTLKEYVEYALAHNPGVEAAKMRYLAAAQTPTQEKALDDPQIVYKYSLQSDTERQSLSIEQMFPWPGTLGLRRKMAEAMAQAELKRFNGLRLGTAFRVKESYYESYYLGRAVAVAGENLDLMKSFHQAALARYRTSSVQYADVVRAEVELGKMENELRMLEEMRPSAAAKLNTAIGRPAQEDRPFPAGIDEGVPAASDGELFDALAKANPEIAAMEAEISAAERHVDVSRKNYRPSIMVGLEWKDMKPEMMDDDFMVMAGISLPIWRGKYRAAESEARFRLRAAQAERADRFNMLSADLAMAQFRLRDATRRMGLYRDTLIPVAKEALKAANTAYSAGNAMFLDLIDSQRSLVEFQLQYERAVADRAIAAAEIEMLTGGSAPSREKAGAPSAAAEREGSK